MALLIPSMLVLLLLGCPADASATPTPVMVPAPEPAPAIGLLQAAEMCLVTHSQSLARAGDVVLGCLAADAVTLETLFLECFVATGLLQAEELCLGIGTHSQALACVGNVVLACLAADAVTGETLFLGCFVAGSATEQCWARPLKAEEEGCIGMGISEDRRKCLGEIAWACRGSWLGDIGIIACFFSRTIECFL